MRARARSSDPGVVLLDLLMPDMDGFAVVEMLRAEPDTADVPIIVLTHKELTRADRDRLAGRISHLAQKGDARPRATGRPRRPPGRRDRRGDTMTHALVLIVEDNPRNLKLVRDLLDHAGYRTLGRRPPRTASSSPARTGPTWC